MTFLEYLNDQNKLVLNEMLKINEFTDLQINCAFKVHAIVFAQLSNKLRMKIQNCSETIKFSYSDEVIKQIIKAVLFFKMFFI